MNEDLPDDGGIVEGGDQTADGPHCEHTPARQSQGTEIFCGTDREKPLRVQAEEGAHGVGVSASAFEPYAIAAALCALNLVWLFLSALGLPGNWLMVATTTAVAVWQWDIRMIGAWALGAVFALAIAGEVAETLSGALAARKVGGTRKAAVGAIVGGFLGALLGTGLVPIPLLGTLIGVGAGAFLGATAVEIMGGATVDRSIRSGAGAAVGQSLGVLAKIAMGAAIWLTVAIAVFWP